MVSDFSYTKDEMIICLKDTKEAMEANVFEGVIAISKGADTHFFVNNGTVTHRVSIVDGVFSIMWAMSEKGEPNKTAFDAFMYEMYLRFKYYFAEVYEKEKETGEEIEPPIPFEETNR